MKLRKTQIAMLASTSALALVLYLITPAPIAVGQAPVAGGPAQIAPVGQGEWTVESREWQDIEDFVPGNSPAVANPPFRPTMDAASYAAAKQQAALAASTSRADAPNQLAPDAPAIGPVSFPGGTQLDNTGVGQPLWYPPDAAGAVGASQFVQVHNAYMRITSKGGVFVAIKSLQSLMGYTTEYLFDPRVQWDPYWNRWIVTAIAFDESASKQLFFIAVSKTNSANGAWYVYSTNTRAFTASGAFWDYAGLGQDQDSITITANVFGTSSFLGAYMFPLAKAQAYNGRPQGFPVFGGLFATLQPGITTKTDMNGYSWFAAAAAGGIRMYTMRDGSRPNATALFGPYTVGAVPGYAVPPVAAQPCGPTVDTLDARFVNSGSQVGDRYYQVHSIAVGPAAVRYYVIAGLLSFAPTVVETGTYFRSGSSADFNASIAANAANDLVITNSSMDAGTFPQVRVVGRTNGSAAISGTAGGQLTIASSPTCISANGSPSRWGDYSQVSVDTTAQTTPTSKVFWYTNELAAAGGTWASRFGKIHF